jgi:hypothetical protein
MIEKFEVLNGGKFATFRSARRTGVEGQPYVFEGFLTMRSVTLPSFFLFNEVIPITTITPSPAVCGLIGHSGPLSVARCMVPFLHRHSRVNDVCSNATSTSSNHRLKRLDLIGLIPEVYRRRMVGDQSYRLSCVAVLL